MLNAANDTTKKNTKHAELYRTNLLRSKEKYDAFITNAKELREVRKTILSNDRYNVSHINKLNVENIKGVITTILSGGKVEDNIKIHKNKMRMGTEGNKKQLMKAIDKYEKTAERTLQQMKSHPNIESKNKIETFITTPTPPTPTTPTSNLLDRRIEYNIQNYKLKDMIQTTMSYIIILCVMFIVFVMSSVLSSGKSIKDVIQNTFNNNNNNNNNNANFD